MLKKLASVWRHAVKGILCGRLVNERIYAGRSEQAGGNRRGNELWYIHLRRQRHAEERGVLRAECADINHDIAGDSAYILPDSRVVRVAWGAGREWQAGAVQKRPLYRGDWVEPPAGICPTRLNDCQREGRCLAERDE